jgi:signal transduction histidine kinase
VSPDVAALLATMSAGETGARTLSRESAESLGLERRMAVAGYAPVRGAPGRPWSIAVVASAMNVRDRARIGAWRLAAATVLAGLLVGVFGWISLRQQRRALGLQEALHLAEATASLRERAEKIVEAIPLGVLALDARGAVTAVNPWLSERAAAPAAALASALPASEPAERAPIEEAVAEARATRKPVERASLTLHLGAGPSRDVDLYAVPLARPLADVDCFLILHDRTETRQLERNLVRAEKLATIGTLAAGVAHELGTPLGIISGRAEQLLARAVAGDANAEPLKKGLASILAQVEKVSTTIRQLLDFARARPVETVKISPAQALGSAQALLEHRFRQAKVALAVDAPVSLPTVAADPAQLEQVFVNLLMNAADACAPGGHVTAQASARGEGVVFEIADDGCGIAPEHLPQVLDPFFTTKKRGQGTGLGLSIAADIVKNHGGALEIESAVGRGTTVRVRLPRAGEERHG